MPSVHFVIWSKVDLLQRPPLVDNRCTTSVQGVTALGYCELFCCVRFCNAMEQFQSACYRVVAWSPFGTAVLLSIRAKIKPLLL